jgi:hypothetical protein
MPPKFAKKDRVKVLATRFDKDEVDENELKFSEKWMADGHGIWCYGQISHVYVKKSRQPQEYNIKYDNGESMRGIEEHLEVAEEDSDSEDDREERKNNDNEEDDSGDESTDYEIDHLIYRAPENDNEVTDDETGEVEEGMEEEMGEEMSVCHPGEYFCKNKTCWSEHLRQVRLDHEVELEI